MQEIIDEHPDIFYVTQWKSNIYSDRIVIEPIYDFSLDEITDLQNKCNRQLHIILSKVYGMSEIDSVRKIHDILARNILYYDDDDALLHTIVAPLLYKKAVCEGYARVFKLLLDNLNIPCIVLSGRGFNESLIESDNHMWNMVRIGFNWYHVDVTYDSSLTVFGFMRYDYFMVDDTTIMVDHYFDRRKFPKADDMSINSSVFTVFKAKNKNALYEYLKKQAENGVKDCVVAMPDSFSVNKIEHEIFDVVSRIHLKNCNEMKVELLCNPARRIAHVRFL